MSSLNPSWDTLTHNYTIMYKWFTLFKETPLVLGLNQPGSCNKVCRLCQAKHTLHLYKDLGTILLKFSLVKYVFHFHLQRTRLAPHQGFIAWCGITSTLAMEIPHLTLIHRYQGPGKLTLLCNYKTLLYTHTSI